MKNILKVSAFALLSFASVSSFAGEAGYFTGIVQCFSADSKVGARVFVQGDEYSSNPSVIVYKQDDRLPAYSFDCKAATTASGWLVCSDSSNRTLVLNKDYSATYVGSHETHDLKCYNDTAIN